MPNQRSANKVRLGGFIDRRLYLEVMALAKREGMAHDKFGFARKLVEEALVKREGPRRMRRTQRKNTSPGKASAETRV